MKNSLFIFFLILTSFFVRSQVSSETNGVIFEVYEDGTMRKIIR
jgi:hypothetical protein